jgi:hypothetical protein
MELSLLSKNMGEARELANRVRNKTAAEITPPDRRDEKATKEMEHQTSEYMKLHTQK